MPVWNITSDVRVRCHEAPSCYPKKEKKRVTEVVDRSQGLTTSWTYKKEKEGNEAETGAKQRADFAAQPGIDRLLESLRVPLFPFHPTESHSNTR